MTTFQGVRSYDASAAQWTTPDAYAGDVHDPMSQQKYMWNNNNPVAYSDPSGYDPDSQEEVGDVEGILERAKITTYAEVERVEIGRQIAKQSGVPGNWTEKADVKTGIVTYTDPASKGATQIRIMPGNPTSRWASQRMPYVRRTSNGNSVDKDGNVVPRQSEASHISIKDFNFQQSEPRYKLPPQAKPPSGN